jgi:phytoene desaturase
VPRPLKIVIIGAGFSGLSAAAALAHAGHQVIVLEKNEMSGGRARKFSEGGFTFDMGPSWYWMPDVFEDFFNKYGKKASDYYQLKRLDPSYRVYFSPLSYTDVPATPEKLGDLFESLEPGSKKKLNQFLEEGKFKYELGINKLVRKPGLSLFEFADIKLLLGVLRLHVFQSISKYVRKFFKHERIVKLLEFPVLFLGATPEDTPALYSLMNYADIALGTWYPEGGMHQIVDAMVKVAEEQGAQIICKAAVTGFKFEGNRITSVIAAGQEYSCDACLATGDYHHIEQDLLPLPMRKYSENYWSKRTFAPSSLIFYLGLNKKLKGLLHHTLFFDVDFGLHAKEIYHDPKWPTLPQFYLSCTSITDNHVAPEGCENIMILIPVAPGLNDEPEIRERYYQSIMSRLENLIGESVLPHVIYKRTYAHRDFISDYNAYKGNAYGLANTLLQTANLKPSIINKKVPNLFYAGQLTVPGPGVPPSIISGEVVAGHLLNSMKSSS